MPGGSAQGLQEATDASLAAALGGDGAGLPTAGSTGQRALPRVWQEPGITQENAFALGCSQTETPVQRPSVL